MKTIRCGRAETLLPRIKDSSIERQREAFAGEQLQGVVENQGCKMSGGDVIGKHGKWCNLDPANLSKNECSGSGASSGESHTKAEDQYGQFIGSNKVGIGGAVTNG